MLNTENYARGFLVDEELMAGVTADPQKAGVFVAFVIQHTTGEYIGYRPFFSLEEALEAINRIPRSWTYEILGGGCGGGGCGSGSGPGCGKGQCQSGKCGPCRGASPLQSPNDGPPIPHNSNNV